MTLKEAAAILGVTPDNLRGAIARGALKATKHGRDWWVSTREVERYGRENRRTRPCHAAPSPDGPKHYSGWCAVHDARWPWREPRCEAATAT